MAGTLQLRAEATKKPMACVLMDCAAPGAQSVPDAHSCEPGEPGPWPSAGGILCPLPPRRCWRSPAQALAVQSWASGHDAEEGTRCPRAPQASFLNCPALCGMPPLQPSSPSVLARPLSIVLIWLCFRNHLEVAHSWPSSGVYQPSQRRCQKLGT